MSSIQKALNKAQETPRTKEIRERNEAAKRSGMEIMAKARHERRHEGKKGTTLQERHEWMNRMSKDN